ncbi:MAG: SDR family NAD(P)-dependent oxidoreductase [Chloroflexi bacterium]|nr:SDR family NAD(P)-dependent oxidoreductase [Chloroflexota bacterium]
MRLNNKTAIVIGGAGGIGKAIAIGFLREGASVAIVDNNKLLIERVEKEGITTEGHVFCWWSRTRY